MNVDKIAFTFADGSELSVQVMSAPRPGLRLYYTSRPGTQMLDIPDIAGFNALRDGLNFIANRNRLEEP